MEVRESIALEIEHLTVNYERTAVLWDVSLVIPQGKLVGIIGPNGAGKSTLLKALMALLKTSSGKSLFFGKPLEKVRNKIAYVPQRASVDWDFPITAFDLVLMGTYGKLGIFKWVSKKNKEAARRALEVVGMEGFCKRQIGELSGGQQQRLFIARALLQEADFYLMDEPFAGVDKGTENTLVRVFQDLQQSGKTILIVHHDLATVEKYFDWIVMLNTCLIASGPVKEVYTERNLLRTYGQTSSLLNQAAKMAKDKNLGVK